VLGARRVEFGRPRNAADFGAVNVLGASPFDAKAEMGGRMAVPRDHLSRLVQRLAEEQVVDVDRAVDTAEELAGPEPDWDSGDHDGGESGVEQSGAGDAPSIRFKRRLARASLVCRISLLVVSSPTAPAMFRTAFIASTAVVLACHTGRQQEASPHTIADFQALRFLEGHWRGSSYAGGPFFESYRFVNDSTVAMTAWSDSTMTTPGEEKRYQLRDGEIGTNDGARLVRVDSAGHTFERGSTRWTFRRVSPDRWTARVGQTTTYTMDRMNRR
jgi:hypothetical protein